MKKILLMVGIVAGASVLVAAQPRGGRGGPPPVDPEKLQAELGIDAQQLERLEQIQRDESKWRIQHRADARIARMELDELLTAEQIDKEAVAAQVDVLAGLQAEAVRRGVDAKLALREILDAEQARKLQTLMRSQRRPRADRGRRGARGRGGPGGPPVGGPLAEDSELQGESR